MTSEASWRAFNNPMGRGRDDHTIADSSVDGGEHPGSKKKPAIRNLKHFEEDPNPVFDTERRSVPNRKPRGQAKGDNALRNNFF